MSSWKPLHKLTEGKAYVTIPVPYTYDVYFIQVPQTAADSYISYEDEMIIRLQAKVEELEARFLHNEVVNNRY